MREKGSVGFVKKNGKGVGGKSRRKKSLFYTRLSSKSRAGKSRLSLHSSVF